MKADSMIHKENMIFFVSSIFLFGCGLLLCIGFQLLGIAYFLIGDGEIYLPGLLMVNGLCLFFAINTALTIQRWDDHRRDWNEFYVRNEI